MSLGVYELTVEGEGDFTFRRRTMRDELRIAAEMSRLTEGLDVGTAFANSAYVFAVLSVLTVRAPAGWDIMDLDPLDPDSFPRIARVYEAMREKEESFRARRRSDTAQAGASDVANAGVPVPASAEPRAD